MVCATMRLLINKLPAHAGSGQMHLGQRNPNQARIWVAAVAKNRSTLSSHQERRAPRHTGGSSMTRQAVNYLIREAADQAHLGRV